METTLHNEQHTVILGGGLAGLTAGQLLSQAGYYITLLEAQSELGGLARTVHHHGFHFDLGGHRFVTNNSDLENYVRNLLGADYLEVSRSSKIFLRGRYFDYPLKPLNAIAGFGLINSISIMVDYAVEHIKQRLGKQKTAVNLEDWVVQQFGRRMFEIYFRDYSEKVWGLDCQHIDMNWVAQRIQGLSLGKAIREALKRKRSTKIPTLSQSFIYPRHGIGQITDILASDIRQVNPVLTQSFVSQVNHARRHITSVKVQQNNYQHTIKADQFVSTIPLQTLIKSMRPLPPARVLSAANQLRSRDLITVSLMLDLEQVTDNTWIYTPEKSIPFGRIHEPTNWSRDMAPANKTLLVAEYFCFRGDTTWASSDENLIEQTVIHLQKLGYIRREQVVDSVVTRIPHAYPLFEVGYLEHCQTIYEYLEEFDNLYTAGRGGMFRYYNMDMAMLAGMEAARHIMQSDIGITDAGLCA